MWALIHRSTSLSTSGVATPLSLRPIPRVCPMSWQITAMCVSLSELEQLAGKHCVGCLKKPQEKLEITETYNVASMFELTFKGTKLEEDGLRGLRNLTSAEAKAEIQAAVTYFETHREQLTALNPPNKWGSYEATLKKLNKMLKHLKKHNLAVFGVT